MSVPPEQVKLVLLGDSGVGKSSLLQRFVNDTFEESTDSTMGASYLSKIIGNAGRNVKFNIWDTAGQERYRALAKMYYRDALVVLLVFSLTDAESFASLKHWYKEVLDNAPKNVVLAVAGNKEDLRESDALNQLEVKKWTEEVHAVYRRTSAKTNYGVTQLFLEIASRLYPEGATPSLQRSSTKLADNLKTQKKPCC